MTYNFGHMDEFFDKMCKYPKIYIEHILFSIKLIEKDSNNLENKFKS